MAKSLKRLNKDIRVLLEEMPFGVLDVNVNEKDMHTIHFLVSGPPETDFAGGSYVVKVKLPPTYPLDAPDFMMMTPNGRFSPGAKVCTSFSAFHPESWSAAYTLTTLIVSFLSFFADVKANANGVIFTNEFERKRFAAESAVWNSRHGYGSNFFTRAASAAAARGTAPASTSQPARAPAAAAAKAGPATADATLAPPASDKAPAAASARGGSARPGAKHVADAPAAAPDPKRQSPAAHRGGGGGSLVDLAATPAHGGPPAGSIRAARLLAKRKAADVVDLEDNSPGNDSNHSSGGDVLIDLT